MYQTINIHDFHRAFHTTDRLENFSYEGRELLFAYLEDLEDETGTPIEFDVIALCCDYSELSLSDVAREYDLSDDEDPLDYLEYNTSVVGVTEAGTVVFQVF